MLCILSYFIYISSSENKEKDRQGKPVNLKQTLADLIDQILEENYCANH